MIYRYRFLKISLRIIGLLLGGAIVAVVIALSRIDLETLRGNVAKILSDAAGMPVEIRGNISWQVSLQPRIVLNDIVIKNAAWAKNPDGVKIDRLSAVIDVLSLIRSNPTIHRLRITNLTAFVEQNSAGEWSMDSGFGSGADSIVAPEELKYPFDYDFGFESLTLTHANITVIRPGQTRKWTMDSARIEYDNGENSLEYRGYFKNNGRTYPFVISQHPRDAARKVYPVSIAFSAGGNAVIANLALEQTSKIPIDFVLTGKIQDAKTIASDFGFEISEIPDLDLNISGGYSNKKLTLRKSSVTIGKYSADIVSGSYDWSRARPKINATLRLGKFSLPELFPDFYKPGPPWVRPKGRELNVFKGVQLYGIELPSYDVNADVQFQQLVVYKNLAINNVSIKANMTATHLLADIAAGAGGGNVRIAAEAMENEGNLWMRAGGRATGVNVGQVMTAIKQDGMISDLPVNLNFYFEANGHTLSEMMSRITGSIELYSTGRGYAGQGLVEYFYGQDFITSLRRGIADLFTSKKKDDQIKISCASVNLKVRSGVIETDRGIAIETNAVNVRATGKVDLGKEQIKASLVTVPVRGIKLSLTGNAINSVEFVGNLAEPSISVNENAIIGKAVSATGIGLLLAPFTGGLSFIAGAGVGFLAGDILENWLSDDHPCKTAKQPESAPLRPDDPDILKKSPADLADAMFRGK